MAWHALVVVALLAIPGISGQFMVDAAGDAAIEGTGAGMGPAGAPYDLRWLAVEEGRDNVEIRFGLESLRDDVLAFAFVPISIGSDAFEVRFRIGPLLAPGGIEARLVRIANGLDVDEQSLPDSWIDADENAIGVLLPKRMLADGRGLPATVGDALEFGAVRFQSPGGVGAEAGAQWPPIVDVMTASAGMGTLVLQDGGALLGDVSIHVQPGAWYTNGEAAIHEFEMVLQNQGETEETVELAADESAGIPELVLGRTRIVVPAGGTAREAAFVLTQFAHQHQGDLPVRATVSSQGARSELTFSLHVPTVPQLAGHHPTLWVHGVDAAPDLNGLRPLTGFWSTLENDDRGSDAPIAPTSTNGFAVGTSGGGEVLYETVDWRLPVSPKLLLDLQTSGENGTASLGFVTDAPLENVELEVSAYLLDGAATPEQQDPVVIARSDTVPLPAQAAGNTFHADVPLASGDARFQVQGTANNLWLHVRLTTWPSPFMPLLIPAPQEPRLVPGSFVELPLIDVPHSASVESHGLDAPALPAAVTPGSRHHVIVTVPTHLMDADFRVVGPDAEWFAWSSGNRLAIDVPADAQVDTRMIAALVARTNEPTAPPGFLPLVLDVIDGPPHRDGTPAPEIGDPQPPAVETGLLPLPFFAILLAAAAMAARRRRRRGS